MKIIIFIIFLIIKFPLFAQQNMEKTHSVEPNERIKSIIKDEIIDVLTIDFTGDKKLDFICRIKENNSENIKEYWLDSDYQLRKIKNRFVYDYDIYLFVNLDSDKEPEIFSTYGFSDGIDYAFYDQDLSNGVDMLMFYFNPVIIDSTQNIFFWGYTWDITDLMIIKGMDSTKILCSVDHNIKRNGEITYPENQNIMPAIFFKGKSTQPDIKVGEIKNISWYDIKKLKELILK